VTRSGRGASTGIRASSMSPRCARRRRSSLDAMTSRRSRQGESGERTVKRAEWISEGSVLRFEIESDAFLRGWSAASWGRCCGSVAAS
jgi:hypothetical protein